MPPFLPAFFVVLASCRELPPAGDDSATAPCASPIDDDGDGYVSIACPSGIDCDDGDPSVNPGALEVCNEKDDDCDGLQPDAPTWYEDADGDGWGNLEASEAACDAPSGFVQDASDCDDANADIHVGGDETCGDAIDQDCDGTDLYCGYLGEYELDDTAKLLTCPLDSEFCGFLNLATGDVTGDGTADLIVPLGVTIQGGAYVLPGGPIDELTLDNAYVVTSSTINKGSGWSVSTPDADGDGTEDVAIGFPQGHSGLDLAHGPIAGDVDLALDADAAFRCPSGDWCGFAYDVADVNGDGDADAVVGAYRDGIGSGPGALFVELGPLVGTINLEAEADVELVGAHEGAGLGFAVDTSHDLNGDGTGDIAVSARADNIGVLGGGAIYLIHGPVEIASLDDADGVLVGTIEGGVSGQPFVVGEIDDDGIPDVAASVQTEVSFGRGVAILRGPVAGRIDWTDADTMIEGDPSTATLGTALALSDVDLDGVEELLVGEWREDVKNYEGAAYLVVTPSTGTSSIADVAQAAFHGSGALDFVGSPLTAGDLDGDGDGDLVIGAGGVAPTGAMYIQSPGD